MRRRWQVLFACARANTTAEPDVRRRGRVSETSMASSEQPEPVTAVSFGELRAPPVMLIAFGFPGDPSFALP